jgi:L-lactate utilization protein LutB
MSDYASTWFDKDIKKIMVDELADKAAAELEQLRAVRDQLSKEVDSLTDEVEKQGDGNVRLASELEEARKIITDLWKSPFTSAYTKEAARWLDAHPEKP